SPGGRRSPLSPDGVHRRRPPTNDNRGATPQMGRSPIRRAAALVAAASLLAAACGDDDETTTSAGDAMEMAADGHDHTHGEGIETGGVAEIPTVAVTATPDPKSGVNLRVETTGLTFAPEHASTEHVLGEGHAHVYVDGEKYGRLYGE